MKANEQSSGQHCGIVGKDIQQHHHPPWALIQIPEALFLFMSPRKLRKVTSVWSLTTHVADPGEAP